MRTTYLNDRKSELVRLAELNNGKPYWSKPVDAKVKNGLIHVKVQESHEFEPHWCMVCEYVNPAE
jgi:hypothetical protein